MSKSYKKEEQYIINAITSEGYDVTPETVQEKLQFLYNTFYTEYNWHIHRYGEFKALSEWLQGLPSSISIVFYNYDILELAKSFGSLPDNATDKEEQKILDNYWKFMAMRIKVLWSQYKIEG